MSSNRHAMCGLAALLVSLAVVGGACAQSSGGGSSGAAGGSPSASQSPAASDVTGGGSGMGGRLPAHEGGVPGGPESERRIPEARSRYTTCPDGSRGDLNAGGCLGGGR